MGTFSCYRWSIAIGLLVVRYVVLVVFLSYHEQHTQIVSAAWVSSSSSSSSSLLLTNSKSIDVSRSTIHNFRSHHNHNRRLRSQQHPHQRTFGMHNHPLITKTSLFYSSAFGGRNDQQNEETSNNSTTITTSILERLQVNGISVSPKGFHLLMEASGGGRDEQEQQQQRKELVELSDDNDNDNNNSNNNDDRNKLDNDMELQQTRDSSTDDDCGGETVSAACRRVVPLKMTTDPADTYQATSPESLTLCQLLSGVDMAGAILPPELLGKIVVYHIEEKYSNNNYDHDNDDHEEEESGIDHDLTTTTTTTTTTSRLSSTEQKVREFIQEQQVLLEEKYSSESSSSDFSSSSSSSSSISYKDAHPWLQSRIRLPQVTLDQLTLAPAPPATSTTNDEDKNNDNTANTRSNNDGKDDSIITTAPPSTTTWRCRLECALPEWNDRLVVDIKPDLLASLVYNYDPESSPLFTCVALALRYKAPIVLEQQQQQQQQQSSRGQQLPSQKEEEGNDESNQDALHDTTTYVDSSSSSSSNTAATYWSRDELDRDFPQRLGVRSLQQQSTRITDNIERGFEIHKLTGALQIAKRLGDEAAAVQIRAKLDDYDSMKDLPTTIVRTHSSSCSNNEEDGGEDNEEKYNDGDGNDRLVDDLDKNILQ